MYLVLLRFSSNRQAASEHMAAHQAWVERGIDDGVFLLVGSIRPGMGGVVLAVGESRDDVDARVAADPFVVHDIVRAEVVDIEPHHADPRLAFLTARAS